MHQNMRESEDRNISIITLGNLSNFWMCPTLVAPRYLKSAPCVCLLREDKHALSSDRWWNARAHRFGVADACERRPLFASAVHVQWRGYLASRAPSLRAEVRTRTVERRQPLGQHPEPSGELSSFATGLHSNMRDREGSRPTLVAPTSRRLRAPLPRSFLKFNNQEKGRQQCVNS
jgi:hypothetical protein